jgi:hypothetical protein
VCKGEPWWPRRTRAFADNAALGPLTNAAGQSLTVVATARRIMDHPTPTSSGEPDFTPEGANDRVRGLAGAMDPTGFYWLTETYMSRRKFAEAVD